jgi:hypothetical protein
VTPFGRLFGIGNLKAVDQQLQLPVILDLAATFLFGITGALAAVQRRYDHVGVFTLMPDLGFTIPYAMSNVLLTAWGPLVVALA